MELKITLKSDLCAASGDGFSSSIDTDVVYDKFGLPLIPSKRIKGALRQIATEVLELETEKIDAIFGASGQKVSGALRLSNAFIEDYDKAVAYLKANPMEPQSVLNLFCYTRAQTAMKNGVAQNGSLRFTRVVSHYLLGKETTFTANVQIDAQYKEDLEKLCKGFRNLGFNKNRGFGSITCELMADEESGERQTPALDAEKQYKLEYKIHLETPVIMAQDAAENTSTYISGSCVMGYFANKLNQDKELFQDMFLKDNIRFSNLYPLKEDEPCVPAISVIGKDKLAEKAADKYLSVFDNANNRVIKPLKNGFISVACEPYEVESEVIFHNAMQKEKKLYSNRCISANQKFYGSILAKGAHMTEILKVMHSGPMSLGRSKTAQYSVCVIDAINVAEYTEGFVTAEETVAQINKDKKHIVEKVKPSTPVQEKDILVYALASHLILTNEYGSTFVGIEDIQAAIEKTANIRLGELCKETSIFYKSISGYNAQWNQKKPQLRCITMGSSIVFRAKAGTTYPCEIFLGDKCEEGFGHLVLYRLVEKGEPKQDLPQPKEKGADEAESFLLKDLLKNASTEEKLMKKALDYVIHGTNKPIASFNTSFIGRVLKMIQEAENIKDLETRIAVIKDITKKNGIQTILNEVKKDGELRDDTERLNYLSYVLTYARYAVKSHRYAKKDYGQNRNVGNRSSHYNQNPNRNTYHQNKRGQR